MDGMSMSMSTPTGQSISSFTSPTSSAAAESTGNMGDMGGMGNSDMDMSNSTCKISVRYALPLYLYPHHSTSQNTQFVSSTPTNGHNQQQMLWNWDTIDACFLSESWHVHSSGGFAALCIGVVLLVVLLQALRRLARIYDQYLLSSHLKFAATTVLTANSSMNASTDTAHGALIAKDSTLDRNAAPFRPNVWQQTIRALLHTLHFAVAYWIMLLAMYYNGYIIICIIIGAFIGFFIFQWERVGPRDINKAGKDATGCHG
ncbi:Ctr-domain-containing protein [Hypomontagnella submonticulosa]|nr:Ctr-domain-containing protein [Hypomontagnella submonticulosa]